MTRFTHIALPLALLVLVVLAVQSGCDGTTGVVRPGEDADYFLQGAVVKDMNRNGTVSVVAAVRNDTTLPNAVLNLDDDTLQFDDPDFEFFTGLDSVYSDTETPVTALPAGQYFLSFLDSGRFRDSVQTPVADTFSITAITPPNRLVQATEQVSLQWSIRSTNIDGYVVAAVKANRAYIGEGYVQVADAGVNQATIPPDAFLSPDSLTPDTGLYNLYVYAFYGTPDSALVHNLLPVPFPLQLADNIARERLTGRFGSVAVTHYDTVRVAVE